MLSQQDRDLLYRFGYVLEHVPEYVEAVSGAEAFLHEGFLCFHGRGVMLFIGYPLGDAPGRVETVYNSACRRFSARATALIAPSVWLNGPEVEHHQPDVYYRLDLPLRTPPRDVAYMVRRASRELVVQEGTFGDEHEAMVQSFVSSRELESGHVEILAAIPRYLQTSRTARLIEARKGAVLVAFNVVDLGSADYLFYVFNFRSAVLNVPGASDLLFHEMARMGESTGKMTMNLGLGVNPGVRRFKEKWGAVPFLPHSSAVTRRRPGLWEMLARLW